MAPNYDEDGFREAERRVIYMLEIAQNDIQNSKTSELVMCCANASSLLEESNHYTLDIKIKLEYSTLRKNIEKIIQLNLEEAKRRDALLNLP